MANKVILHNVIDTRTEKFHSVAVVKKENVKWFKPFLTEPEPEPLQEPEAEIEEEKEETEETEENN